MFTVFYFIQICNLNTAGKFSLYQKNIVYALLLFYILWLKLYCSSIYCGDSYWLWNFKTYSWMIRPLVPKYEYDCDPPVAFWPRMYQCCHVFAARSNGRRRKWTHDHPACNEQKHKTFIRRHFFPFFLHYSDCCAAQGILWDRKQISNPRWKIHIVNLHVLSSSNEFPFRNPNILMLWLF